ncbi:MAG TPA: response regulator [Actinomycetota bacterium]
MDDRVERQHATRPPCPNLLVSGAVLCSGSPVDDHPSCAGAMSDMANARILVVDDDQVIQQLLKVNLELEGYEVEVASDGEEALRSFGEFRPHLVLLDIMMPKMDGWEVSRRLKEGPASGAVPIVLLSARAQDSDVKRGSEIGVAAYVTKPFDPIALLDLVADLLARRGFQGASPRLS